MEKCKYKFYDDKGIEIEFGDLAELDHFLYHNYSDRLEKAKSGYKFSANSSIDKFESMKKELESKITSIEERYDPLFGGVETYYKIDGSVGANRFVDEVTIEGKHLVTPFNQSEYFKEENIFGDKEVAVKDGWKIETDASSIIHKIGELVMSDQKVDISNVKLLGQNDSEAKELVRSFKEAFEDLKDKLKQKHGKKCKILTELPIISKDLPEPFSNIYKTINGRIDLLVIDEKGNAHIYDYKGSKKDVGRWDLSSNKSIVDEWPTIKKLKIEYQMEIYRAILEQYGIHVSSVNIIPIKVEYNTSEKYGLQVAESVKGFSIGDIISDSNGMKRRIEKVSQFLPVKYITDKIDGIKSIIEPINIMFPDFDPQVKGDRSRASFDRIKASVHTVNDNDPDRVHGKYWFSNKFETNKKTYGKTYCNTLEEIDQKINEYIKKINDESANEWAYISNQLQAIYDESQDFESLSLKTASRDENEFIRRIFSKYFNPNGNKWHYQKNDTLSTAGIFVFTNDNNVAEIVILSDQELDQVIKLGKGTSLLGAFKKDYEIDEHKTFKATNGNLNIMKAISLINSEYKSFEGYKINSISVHNTMSQKTIRQPVDVMFDNFRDASLLAGIKLNIDKNNFSSILEYVESTVEDLCGESLMTLSGTQFSFKEGDRVYNLDMLNRLKEVLESRSVVYREIHSEKPNYNIPEVLAHQIIQEAILRLNGYMAYVEKDPAVYLETRDGLSLGSYVTSFEKSPSKNLQTVGNIVAKASIRINQLTAKSSTRIGKELDALYESKGRNKLIGGEVKYFDNLFRVDDNGNKDPRFLLKKENDPSLSKEEKAFIIKFLEIINDLKYNGDQSKISEIRHTDSYYEVPLTKGRGFTTFHNMSMKDMVKQSYSEALNFLNIFQGQEGDVDNARRSHVAYNKFKVGDDVRKKILSENDINSFETHLGILILEIINTYHKEQVWNEALPQIHAIKNFLIYEQTINGHVTKNTLDAIEKYIDVNIFSKAIMDLKPIYKMLSTVRSVAGATVLGLNIRSGIRELMQGMWNHLSRTMVQMYGKGMFKSSDILKAWTIVFKLSIKNPNLITLLDAVNAEYGMVNADVDGIKELLNKSQSGVLNWGSDSLYIFNRIPDAYHRMGILIAQMLHDGCWDAHTQDEYGLLVYDFKKDARFNLLTNPNANKNSKEYKEQLDLYLTMAEQFRVEGYDIPQITNNHIPPLPRAYTVQEGLSIKSFADLCFGYYDKRTQMLAKHMFLGSFFLQFRTFLSAKLEQWILKPGTYNIGSYRETFDVDGVRIMRVIKFNNQGIPHIEFKREDELEKGDIATPHKTWQGKFMEGIAYSMWDFGNALAKMNTQDLKELWKNDTKRANFYLFLIDMALMSAIMAVIQALLLDNDEIEWTPSSHMLAMALYTSFSDGPITQLLSSMGGDLNPPMYTTVKSMYNNTVNLVTGDMEISKYLTGTFGALRDLEYLVK